jgi:hypothetical protein
LDAITAVAGTAVAAHFAMARTWRPISFVKSLSFKGGYQGHALPVESREVETPGGTLAFLKLEKRCEWLCKAVAGPKANIRDALKRSRLFDELRSKIVEESARGDPAGVVPVAVAAEPENDENDPMNALVALDDVLVGSDSSGRKRKDGHTGTAYSPKRRKTSIISVEMPEQERTRWPTCTKTRNAKLIAQSTNSLWISSDDVEWLIHWLVDEIDTGGVPIEDESAVGLEANCAAPGVHIRWDFNGAWEALASERDSAVAEQGVGGTVLARSLVSKLTLEKWEIVDNIYEYGVDFSAATPNQRKNATFHYLEQRMVHFVAEAATVAAQR